MMAMKKARFAETYSTGFHPNFESEGSDNSARLDGITAHSEDSMAPRQKWIDLNSSSRDFFDVPAQVLAFPMLTSSEKKSLCLRFKSELEKIQALKKKYPLLRSNSSSSVGDVPNVPLVQSKKPFGPVSKSGRSSTSSTNKARGNWNRASSGRFQAVKNEGHSSNSKSNPAIMKMCENVLKKLMSHQYGWVFNTPVDAVKLNIPDYYTVIKHPMDLGTIKKKLASGEYQSPLEFCADVKLTFSNAKTYNPPGNDVHIMAEAMSKFFELRWKDVEKKFPTLSQSLADKSGPPVEMEMVKTTTTTTTTTIPTKKRKLTEPEKPKMSAEEKSKLTQELEGLLEDLPEKIVVFLKEQISNAGESAEDEIELDIEDLSEDALFTLRKLLDEHFLEKQKIAEKGEPCEIELPNESGLSSSSMQADKGNDLVDEDVDIGEDEPPVSSYPAVEIGRDKAILSDRKQDMDPCYPSDGEVETDALTAAKQTLDDGDYRASHEKEIAEDLAEGNQSVSGLDQLEQSSLEKPNSDETDSPQDGKNRSYGN
ncbi:OLC1v1011782C1 [Oldenlandia corymbosa var. corymbosa]|uniref:OLC1v1011782C1 n=1 Tax=Oldenlandia corymbosa var. corymbosa TaxID=529605 RepID=A0AAV1DUJ8_OLDCO|nr:OLC1v1011782C1 [Oldenlandia corymbosa var. corymbosa]